VLGILDSLNLKITFFIVGKDAALKKNQEYLQELTNRGHEVGNHSYNHEPWIHSYSDERMKREVLDTEQIIEQVTGQKPTGFRGPGFCWNKNLLTILSENEYLFDASTFPTYIGPLARLYYFCTSELTNVEKSKRNSLFGSFKEGFKPVHPYYWELENHNRLLEIPVTTFPIAKIPFHLSYLMYLACYSETIMWPYLSTAIGLCRLTDIEPSFLLHPLDIISGDQVPELKFFPGMNISGKQKRSLFKKVINKLSMHFKLVNMSTLAHATLKNKKLRNYRI